MKNAAKKRRSPLLPLKPATLTRSRIPSSSLRGGYELHLPQPIFTKMAVHCAERDIDLSTFIAGQSNGTPAR